ncbi:putative uncharacterized protein DDB_G0277255 [Panonychus citri]|uniref:putative uncharacterized protein DDB_G0277255 n=1 Tax=Panonychus citri TaxID=50023 RepID=UPI0023079CCA|nr:putative uncharacterized protein DDB_G0277255 [Panonychus citri]
MLFHNCGDRNLNLDLTASLPFTQSTYFSRHSGIYKDPCKIISKFVDFDEPTESDRYIGDLSIDEDLEKEIEVGFFDNLKTPSEELKGFTPIDESNPLVSGLIAAVTAAYNSTTTPTSPTPSSAAFFITSDAIKSTENSLIVPSSSSSSSSLPSSLSTTPSITPSPSPLPSAATSTISVISDTEMEEDRKSIHVSHHLSHLQVKQTSNNNTDSLMTPIIDPNASTSEPHFPTFDNDNVFGQYLQELTQAVSCDNQSQQLQAQDIKPAFGLAPSPVMYTDRSHHHHQHQHHHHQQQQHQHQHQQQLQQQQHSLDQSLSISTPSLHHLHHQTQQSTNQSNLDRYSIGSSTISNQHDFEYPTTLPGISGYTNRSNNLCDVDPTSSSLGMVGTSPSLTPSSSTSSMSYAELKPRSYSFSQPSTSLSTDNLVPTVVEDHPYTSRHNTSSPFDVQPSFSPPSSCPSTSSLASTSDQRETSRDLFSLINDVDYPTLVNRKRHPNKHHESSTRRGRLTKKEKLDKMVSEEKRLESENTMLKDQLKVMEHQFKVLQTKITDILIDAAKRKS